MGMHIFLGLMAVKLRHLSSHLVGLEVAFQLPPALSRFPCTHAV